MSAAIADACGTLAFSAARMTDALDDIEAQISRANDRLDAWPQDDTDARSALVQRLNRLHETRHELAYRVAAVTAAYESVDAMRLHAERMQEAAL
jgi:hypothetical protein